MSPERVWVPPGERTTVRGLELPGGMLYIGQGLAAVRGYRDLEPALIDPELPADTAEGESETRELPYWPCYADITAECRGAYLAWLAGGRRNPDVAIGYVFLFLYGLERRILADSRTSEAARLEVPTLLAEVERLLRLYRDNGSFRTYGSDLLAAGRVLLHSEPLYSSPPPRERVGWDIPMDLRVALGQLVADGRPITGAWAFAWFLFSPESHLRTPARRCAEEFETLFQHRFAERFPDGLSLKPNKRRLKWEYRPASPSFGGRYGVEIGDLPDVAPLARPRRIFQEIADQCTQELDAYSRYLGRNPDGAGSISAFGLLPAELAASRAHGEAGKLAAWAEDRLGKDPTVLMGASELMALWEHDKPKRLSKKEATSFSHVLAKLGLGLEPDVRFGGPPLAREGHAVVFRLNGDHTEAPSHEYLSSTVLMHLAAVVAAADGTITPSEEALLERHLEQAMHMTESETARLRAHLQWLLAEQPGLSGLKKRLETVPQEARIRISQTAVAVAGADGRIDPEEITVLRKLYTSLGLDPEAVYADIHALAGQPATEPITVRHGASHQPGYAIPSAAPRGNDAGTDASPPAFALDPERVQAKLRATAEVESLLADIFGEQEESASQSTPDVTADGETADGIDGHLLQLLRGLKGRPHLTRQEFEVLADEAELLPDGAFDLINELAFDQYDCPLLEGDDPIEINDEVLQGILK